MFSLEYKQSRGCGSEYQWHKNIIDMYIIYKDNQRIFSERSEWYDYYLMLEINHLDKDIRLLKRGRVYDNIFPDDFVRGRYAIKYEDCASIVDDLTIYIEEIKELLDIQNYSIRLYA